MRVTPLLTILLMSAAISFSQNQQKQIAQKETAVQKKTDLKKKDSSSLILNKAVIALNVNNLEPENVSDTFPSEVHRLFCFTQIKGATGPTEIQHRWYWKEELMGTVSLQINSGNFRTYSSKSIPKGLCGDWRVSIINSKDESIIGTIKFITQ